VILYSNLPTLYLLIDIYVYEQMLEKERSFKHLLLFCHSMEMTNVYACSSIGIWRTRKQAG